MCFKLNTLAITKTFSGVKEFQEGNRMKHIKKSLAQINIEQIVMQFDFDLDTTLTTKTMP